VTNWKYVAYAVLIPVAFALPFFIGPYLLHTAYIILIYLALALSWDMLVRTGQISFGVAGMFGIGGYAAAMVQISLEVNPLISIVIGGLVAGGIALVLGLAVLQLRGMYFAIITLALAEIFRLIIRNLPELTGGPMGLVLPSAIFGGDTTKTYWLVLVIALATVAVSEILNRSRVHFALTSIRNNEIVAKSSGIGIFKYLVIMFTITSAIQGIVGATYAQAYGFVSPEGSFSLNFSLLPMATALFGGMYSTWGPVLGAIVLGGASEFLKLQLPYGHFLLYGAIIVVVILFLPKGIVGVIKKALDRQ